MAGTVMELEFRLQALVVPGRSSSIPPKKVAYIKAGVALGPSVSFCWQCFGR